MSQPNPMHIRPFMTPSGPAVPPDDHESIPLTEASDRLVEQGISAARANKTAEAIKFLDLALAINEDNVEALLWRGGLSEPNASLPFLEKAAYLDPTNERARDGLLWAKQRVGLAPKPVASTAPVRPAASTPPPPQPVASAPVQPAAKPPLQYVQPVQVTYGKRPQQAAPPDRTTAPVQPAGTPDGANAYQSVIAPTHPTLSRSSSGPGIFDMLLGVVTFLIERPGMALVIAIMLLAMLGTAAMARAGMSRNSVVPQPTPQVLLENGKAVVPVANPTPIVLASSSKSITGTTQAPVLVVASPSTLDQAWSASDWPQVLLIITEMLKRQPGDAALTQKLLAAHYNYGLQLVRSDRLSDAIDEFDSAIEINANDQNVLNEKKFATLYLTGSSAFAKGDFGSAIPPLRQIVDANPGYRSAKKMLYQAYIGYSDELEKQGNKSDAYTYYLKASK